MNIVFRSLGCRTNQEEFAELTATLSGLGHQIVTDIRKADIIMVNSCSVTGATESKTRRMIASIADAAPRARILVTGCLAQQDPVRIKTMKNVAWVVGNRRKHEIPAIIATGDEGVFHTEFTSRDGEHLALPSRQIVPPAESNRTRFSVKIQEGCDFRCSYCIVPSLRGPSRSASYDEILSQCRQACYAGYKEIVMTGTHIGQFRSGSAGSITELVNAVVAMDGDFRVRLSSLDPRDCTPEVFSLVGNGGRVCNHLHVSLQSGSPAILEKMGRPADQAQRVIAELVRFREQFPAAGIGADIIVGFPGESEEDFLETCSVIEKVGFSYLHVFRFSRRPGTAAADLPGQIHEKVKNDRSMYLRRIAARSRNVFLDAIAAEPQRIIVESESPLRGLTSNYIHVEVDKISARHNSWLDVFVTGANRGRYCLAEPV